MKNTVEIYSASVAAGALNETPVLDLYGLEAVELLVDNVAGTAARDLQMTTFLDDGVTVADQVVLRRCPFGSAPPGGSYAPGRSRGHLGPSAGSVDYGIHLLYDETSAPNAALNSPDLWTDGLDRIFGWSKGAGGTHTFVGTGKDDAGAGLSVFGASGASADNTWAWPTTDTENVAVGNWRIAFPRPRRVSLGTSAGGVGISVRIVCYGAGRTPGSFSRQMALPRKVKFSLLAGGAGAARLTVLG